MALKTRKVRDAEKTQTLGASLIPRQGETVRPSLANSPPIYGIPTDLYSTDARDENSVLKRAYTIIFAPTKRLAGDLRTRDARIREGREFEYLVQYVLYLDILHLSTKIKPHSGSVSNNSDDEGLDVRLYQPQSVAFCLLRNDTADDNPSSIWTPFRIRKRARIKNSNLHGIIGRRSAQTTSYLKAVIQVNHDSSALSYHQDPAPALGGIEDYRNGNPEDQTLLITLLITACLPSINDDGSRRFSLDSSPLLTQRTVGYPHDAAPMQRLTTAAHNR
ncbi:hypothetical protein CIB48_g3599 [Xylaria polymorpha]|nr:hypothetical protein CIB48_g3599 [Xylaria polymorpha]